MLDQELIAEKLQQLNKSALLPRAFAALKEEFGYGTYLLARYAVEVGGVPDSALFEPSDYPELQESMDAFLLRRASEAIDEQSASLPFDLEIEEGAIVVWRALVVPTAWVENGLLEGQLGVCWAFDPDFAIAHGGAIGAEEQMEVRLKGRVDFYDVDWPETVLLNAVDEFTVGEECEIRLKETATIDLLLVEDKDTDRVLADYTHRPLRLSAGEQGTLAKAIGF